eukprot:scaffold185395_cov35-Attheya_sp.AAC.1
MGCRYHTNVSPEDRFPFVPNHGFMSATADGGTNVWVEPSVDISKLPENLRAEFEDVKRTRSGWGVMMAAFGQEMDEADLEDPVKNAVQYGDKA